MGSSDGVFEAARAHGWDPREVLDFRHAANPMGPSPRVRVSLTEAADLADILPEREPAALTGELASLWGVPPEQLLLGAGAAELLYFFSRETGYGPVSLAVPAPHEHHQAFRDAEHVSWADPAGWPPSGLLVISQPNSATGERLSYEELAVLTTARRAPLLIDESGVDFAGVRSAVGLIESSEDLFVLRSLGPLYGLSGLWVGVLAGPAHKIAALRERRPPWTVSVPAEAAARAAIADVEHAEAARSLLRAERRRLADVLSAMPGLIVSDSESGSLLVWSATPAGRIRDALLAQKMLIEVWTGTPGIEGEAFGVAPRKPEQNDRLTAALKRILAGS